MSNMETGNQTSHEPRTGTIDTIMARKVNIMAFGTPRRRSPIPTANPCIIPMRTCPNTIALVIPRSSFDNFFSVSLENGERLQR